MNISHIDHIVLTVTSIEKSIQFYTTVLNMKAEKFGNNRTALRFGNQKINLHQQGDEIKPNALNAIPGSQDLCFITTTNIKEAMQSVTHNSITIIDGPVSKTGATGAIVSFFFRDPDNNLIEVSNYI